jgi:hypothetical protein
VAVGQRLDRGASHAKLFLLPQRPYVPIGNLCTGSIEGRPIKG